MFLARIWHGLRERENQPRCCWNSPKKEGKIHKVKRWHFTSDFFLLKTEAIISLCQKLYHCHKWGMTFGGLDSISITLQKQVKNWYLKITIPESIPRDAVLTGTWQSLGISIFYKLPSRFYYAARMDNQCSSLPRYHWGSVDMMWNWSVLWVTTLHNYFSMRHNSFTPPTTLLSTAISCPWLSLLHWPWWALPLL